jgi:hypothetical protein
MIGGGQGVGDYHYPNTSVEQRFNQFGTAGLGNKVGVTITISLLAA